MQELTFIFMDAGQGDSTLVIYPDKSIMLVDCGSTKNGSVVAKEIQTVLNRYLPGSGHKIDHLILTHPDQDHYNLLNEVIIKPNVRVEQVYYGGDISLYQNGTEHHATYLWLRSRTKCGSPPNTFGGKGPDPNLSRLTNGVEVYVLAVNATGSPKRSDSHGRNTNSIVLLFIYQGNKVFLMGDASKETEDFILDSCKRNKLTHLLTNTGQVVLKMGHHGSDTSSSEDWVKALTPNILVISSDARHFGASGKGMPTKTHLGKVEAWSGKVLTFGKQPTFCPCHPYVIYHDDHSDPYYRKFTAEAPTRKAICTTLYAIKYDSTGNNFDATGGSWYYDLKQDGSTNLRFTGWDDPSNHWTCS